MTRGRVAVAVAVVAVVGLVAGVALVRRGSPPRPPAATSPAAPTIGNSSPSGPVAWSPTGAAAAAATAADPTTAPTWPGSTTTATTTAPLSAAGVATAITAAYLTNVSGPARRAACRPYADAELDATLAAPSWSGATASVTPPSSVTIRPADVVAADITSTAIGYELVATPNGGAPVAVQVRVLKQPDGRWLADSVSVS